MLLLVLLVCLFFLLVRVLITRSTRTLLLLFSVFFLLVRVLCLRQRFWETLLCLILSHLWIREDASSLCYTTNLNLRIPATLQLLHKTDWTGYPTIARSHPCAPVIGGGRGWGGWEVGGPSAVEIKASLNMDKCPHVVSCQARSSSARACSHGHA